MLSEPLHDDGGPTELMSVQHLKSLKAELNGQFLPTSQPLLGFSYFLCTLCVVDTLMKISRTSFNKPAPVRRGHEQQADVRLKL